MLHIIKSMIYILFPSVVQLFDHVVMTWSEQFQPIGRRNLAETSEISLQKWKKIGYGIFTLSGGGGGIIGRELQKRGGFLRLQKTCKTSEA